LIFFSNNYCPFSENFKKNPHVINQNIESAFYKWALEFYFAPIPTGGLSIFSENYKVAALS